ncbi:MAG: lipopolysaccharide transport periplasmic protein LptA [Bacteroidales bacterium]|nr:lipopolysaccharide transport periplasmic protein LptA [Bacteroidales bacterium]
MRVSGKLTTNIATVAALCAALLAGTAVALPSDPRQPIEIEAGSAMRDERQGVTVYERDVTIRQGSILITADKVSVHSAGNQIDHIVATGSPAHYQQQLKPGENPVVARAATIEYQLAADQIHLVGNASLEQDGTTLTGSRIDYDLRQEVIRASGDNAEGGRIRMVIPPDQQRTEQPPDTRQPAPESLEESEEEEGSAQ